MADFNLTVLSGMTTSNWVDGPVVGPPAKPSRQNAIAGLPHKKYDQTAATDIILRCLVGGLFLADAALGGRLFLWSWVDLPTTTAPTITVTAGSSAEVTIAWADTGGASLPGHYTILASRADGGGQGLSWETP